NTDELLLSQGGNGVVGSNSIVTNLWNQSLLLKSNAELILNNLNIVTDQGTKGALYAHAAIFKALALGNLALFWQSAPIVTQHNAPFVDRIAVLNEAITLLDNAGLELAKAPISATFTSRIVSGIDYANTINALTARYALMAGNYNKALSAANLVNLAITVKSGFIHDDLTRNAMFDNTFGNKNVTEPIDDKFSLPLALPTPLSDTRIAFFFNPAASATINRGRASFFTANTTTIPIYRPGEIMLIKAEANIRKTSPDLPAALTQLNLVLQKTPAQDAWGIGASQPAYAGPGLAADLLDEIYKQRCIELYMTGLRLEDSRRFGRPASERGRSFLPYPFTERDNNPTNTPTDPTF
ncbi:MAG TPA: RagB/SusD family nutrient uptake outer membrane protein, partial [Cyclobacteriaceae bacterium]|nr:RagB/SusD family nutrient uptake outer membrane protein [Cyclobacteriaceae bacterium]